MARRPTNKGMAHTWPTTYITRPGHRKGPKPKHRRESQSTGRNHSAKTIRRMGGLMGRKVR